MTRYMVIESIREVSLDAVYRRFHQRGRMLPDGLEYVDSRLTADGSRVFQPTRTETPALFPVWTVYREDLIVFEIVAIGAAPGPE